MTANELDADLQYVYDERYAIALGDGDDHEAARQVAQEAVEAVRADRQKHALMRVWISLERVKAGD